MEAKQLPALLNSAKKEFSKILPGHITPDMFARTAQTALAMTHNIEKVKDPRSLLIACSKAAADGLIVDGREAALIIDFRGNVRYQPMMRGLLKLAYNSDEIASISVQAVYDADVFEYVLGDEDKIVHQANLRVERGEIFVVYAIAKLRNGAVVREVMTTAQINAIRDRSDAYKAFKAKKIKSTPWHTDWEEMARKTVFRRLSKYIPSSTEKDRLVSAVERIDDDYDFVSEGNGVEISEPTKKKRGGGAKAMEKVIARPETEIIDQPEEKENPAPDQNKTIKKETVEQQRDDDI